MKMWILNWIVLSLLLQCIIVVDAFSPILPNHGLLVVDTIKNFPTSIRRSSLSLFSTTSSETEKGSPLPPAISLEGLTCSHDGGNLYQLKDVNYVLPRGGKIGLVGRKYHTCMNARFFISVLDYNL
jgi:ABC-type transport system involved in cytochrome bd biosynthesis fused ATPase/permease subunit